jgi:archaellum component FlaD/FlaE
MARVSNIPNEKRDDKAKSLWDNLSARLGLRPVMVKTASVEGGTNLLSDAIQTHARHQRDLRARMPVSDAAVVKVADQQRSSQGVMTRFAAARSAAEIFTGDKVGSTEEYAKVKGAVENLRGKLDRMGQGLGARAADHVRKVDELGSMVANISDKEIKAVPSYKTALDEVWNLLDGYGRMLDSMIQPPQADGLMGPHTQVAPGAVLQAKAQVENQDLAMAQAYNQLSIAYSLAAYLSAQSEAQNVGQAFPSMIPAGQRVVMTKKASADLRGTMDKFAFEIDEIEEPEAVFRVILSGDEIPRVAEIRSNLEKVAIENGWELAEGYGDSIHIRVHNPESHSIKTIENVLREMGLKGVDDDIDQEGSSKGFRVEKIAASGDPGDREMGNLVYKDLGRCRDCVWFESDFSHETYRDKCKHCLHAKLGGVVDHWWPRSMQMSVWAPMWMPPMAEKAARFEGTLSALDSHRIASNDVQAIADAVVEGARASAGQEPLNARIVAGAFMKAFGGVLAGLYEKVGGHVAARVAEATGLDFYISRKMADAWGWKNAAEIGDGEVILASPMTLQEELEKKDKDDEAAEDPMARSAKGERTKIRTLRDKLEKADEPGEIKALNDAIDSLESRMDKDKASKEKRKKEREEKQKAKADQVQEPAKTAGVLHDIERDMNVGLGEPWQKMSPKYMAELSDEDLFATIKKTYMPTSSDEKIWEVVRSIRQDQPAGKTAAFVVDEDARTKMTEMGLDSGNPEHVKQFLGTMRLQASAFSGTLSYRAPVFKGSLCLGQVRG